MAETELMNLSGQVSNGPEMASQSQAAEEMIPKSHAENLIKNRVKEASESGYRRGLEEAKTAYQPNSMGQASAQAPMNDQAIEERLLNRLQQKFQSAQESAYWNKVAGDFLQKDEVAKQKYPDTYKDTVAPIVEDVKNNPAFHSNFVRMISGLENGADVLKELGDHPQKFAEITMMANSSPNMAKMSLNKISNSIKQNQQVQEQPNVNPPLSQMKPSNNFKDNGSARTSFKGADWLKG